MARKTTRSFAGVLRAWGSDHPERGFTLAEQVQPVAVVSHDADAVMRTPSPTIFTRFYRAALAGSYSLGAYTAPPGGALVIEAEIGAAGTRMYLYDDGTDGILANAAAIDPVGNFRTRWPFRGRLRHGTSNVDPNPGTEIITFAQNDILRDIYLPGGCAIAFSGAAANTIVTVGWFHVREGVDA